MIKQEDDNHEYLKRVLDLKMPELKTRYGDDSMEFENMVGRLPKLHIKYSDKQLDWLTTASPAEISEFAKIIYDDAWELRWFIEETADRLFEDKVA